jgi:hypothetical protein
MLPTVDRVAGPGVMLRGFLEGADERIIIINIIIHNAGWSSISMVFLTMRSMYWFLVVFLNPTFHTSFMPDRWSNPTSPLRGFRTRNCSQSVSNRVTLSFARVISSTLMMEAIRSSETSVYNKPTRRHIPEDGILHSQRRENPNPT